MNNVNVLMGPKLGDFLHSLVVPAFYYRMFGKKTNLYINEVFDTWANPLEDTYKELYPIIMNQDYINSFEIFDKNKHRIDHDLNQFRYNRLIYTRPFWAVFLHSAFMNNPVIPKNFITLKVDPDYTYKDYLLVHRKDGRFEWNDFTEKQYLNVMNKFEKKLFIAFNEHDYDKFPLKDKIDLLVVKDLSPFLSYLKGSKMLLTNATSTLCMASAMNVPRIGEVGKFITPHYCNDHMFYDNVEFFDPYQIFTPNCKYLEK